MPRIRITESKVKKTLNRNNFDSPSKATENGRANLGPANEPKYFEGTSATYKFDKHS